MRHKEREREREHFIDNDDDPFIVLTETKFRQ